MSEQDSRERFVVNVSVVIPQSLADRMDAAERCKHDGRSSFIREAIRKMLDECEANHDA